MIHTHSILSAGSIGVPPTGDLAYAHKLFPHDICQINQLNELISVELLRLPLFWFLLAASVALSHAPGSIRHRRIF